MRIRQPMLATKLKAIAKDIAGMDTLDNNLEMVRYFRTMFPPFNRAIVLGGAPFGAVWSIHGPYQGGKSTFSVGLLASAQRQGHITAFVDAEHAASKKWFMELGLNPETVLFYRPDYLEDTSDTIDTLIERHDKMLKDGNIGPEVGMIIVVDSINKLTPISEYKRFKKEGAEALEKGLARYRGMLLQAWLDHMTPIIGKRNIALILIAQEREKKDAKLWETDYTIKGCQGLMFDALVRLRIMLGSKIWIGPEGKKIMVGQQHNGIVFKNKVGYPNERFTFYTSNGKGGIPIGFDHGRTLLKEGIDRGVIEQAKAWYKYQGQSWNGEEKAAIALNEDLELLQQLRDELDGFST